MHAYTYMKINIQNKKHVDTHAYMHTHPRTHKHILARAWKRVRLYGNTYRHITGFVVLSERCKLSLVNKPSELQVGRKDAFREAIILYWKNLRASHSGRIGTHSEHNNQYVFCVRGGRRK